MKPCYRLFVFAQVLLSVLWPVQVAAEPADLESPTIELRDITLVSLTVDAAHLVVDLDVHNPNPVNIDVETILYGLTLNQTPIKYDRIVQPEHFPARSERVVRVPVSLVYNEHLPDILAALSSALSSSYEIAGSVKLKGEETPFLFYHKGQLISPPASNDTRAR